MSKVGTALIGLIISLCGTDIFAQGNVYYVDGDQQTPGTGTMADPFGSVSYALTFVQPGDTVMVKGSNDPYRDDHNNLQVPELDEQYPIHIPTGVTLAWWQGQFIPAQRARFKQTQSNGKACFAFDTYDTGSTSQILAYAPLCRPCLAALTRTKALRS